MTGLRQIAAWDQLAFLIIGCTVLTFCSANHFRGGTISWKSVGGNKVEFFFKLAWTYKEGPGCTESKIGQFVGKTKTTGNSSASSGGSGSKGGNNGSNNSQAANNYWKCKKGCGGTVKLATTDYFCMAASKTENWEQGQSWFNYTFPNAGQFVVAYKGNNWMKLAAPGTGNGSWSVKTTVDLRTRSDIGKPNSSPVAQSQSFYRKQLGCLNEIQIPVLDPDGDNVRCRWAVKDECKAVCNALPSASLNETTCTISFNATNKNSYVSGGYYAVAITIEDYPQNSITLGGNEIKIPSDRLSSVPLQFLIQTQSSTAPCKEKPRFVSPTPAEGSIQVVLAGETLTMKMVADNRKDTSSKIKAINIMGPVQLKQSRLKKSYQGDKNTLYKTLTWDTTLQDVGEHIVCAYATNDRGKSSDTRCITVKIDPNGCLSMPCQNGGSCQSTKGIFNSCSCPSGFTGVYCETDIDDCKSGPCLNGGSCVDKVDNFHCLCPPGYTDRTCSTDIDECAPKPCLNGGTCKDQINAYSCLCSAGYTDSVCSTDIDDCNPNHCQNGATCIDHVNAYLCDCMPGYTDKNCATNIDDCKSGPCLNGGTCVDDVNDFHCICPPGYTDSTCFTDIDDCNPAHCQNGATCIDHVNAYSCDCMPGYTDKNCATNIDDCNPDPCGKSATCLDQVNGYSCTCLPGYSGTNCSDFDECHAHPCENNATCIDLTNDYSCVCLPGYTDKNCSTDIDDCSPDPCRNSAACVDLTNDYLCVCLPGYTDKKCSTDIDDCLPDPCQHSSTCIDLINDYSCVCLPGFTDKNCFTDIDDCLPDPCRNSSTCIDLTNDYSCVCLPGYTDKNCSTDIDDCLPDPCHHSSTCIDLINDYSCVCLPGYTDKNCSTDIDDCMPDLCQNGGTCLDHVNAYSCVCLYGFTDKNCSTTVDFCQPDPCSNGGVCQNSHNNFTCQCVNGWQGLTCNQSSPPSGHRNTQIGSCSSIPGNSIIGPTKRGCCETTDYNDCHCVISPHYDSPLEQDRTLRNLLATFIGLPFGLGFSLLTTYLYYFWRPSTGQCRNHKEKHQPSASTQQTWGKRSLTPERKNQVNLRSTRRKSHARKVSSVRPFFKAPPSDNLLPMPSLKSPQTATDGMSLRYIYETFFEDDAQRSTTPKNSPNQDSQRWRLEMLKRSNQRLATLWSNLSDIEN